MTTNPYDSPKASAPSSKPAGRMQYIESYRSFFNSPKWGMNMLFGAVAQLVPIAGPMVYVGWLGDVIKTKIEHPEAPQPDFDMNKLAYYLGRGLWPVLVQIVVGLLANMVLMPCFMTFYLGGLFGGGAIASGDGGAIGFVIMILGLFTAFLVLFGGILIMQIYMVPMTLRASLEQDFGKSFQWQFIKSFTKTVRKELILAMLFLTASSFVLALAGMCVFIVGVYAAAALITFAHYHLMLQLYLLYLSRGGEAIPIKDAPSFGGSPAPQPAPAGTPPVPPATT